MSPSRIITAPPQRDGAKSPTPMIATNSQSHILTTAEQPEAPIPLTPAKTVPTNTISALPTSAPAESKKLAPEAPPYLQTSFSQRSATDAPNTPLKSAVSPNPANGSEPSNAAAVPPASANGAAKAEADKPKPAAENGEAKANVSNGDKDGKQGGKGPDAKLKDAAEANGKNGSRPGTPATSASNRLQGLFHTEGANGTKANGGGGHGRSDSVGGNNNNRGGKKGGNK